MKNNFSNFIKIIFIIIGVSLIIGLVFFIITKNDYTASSNNKVSSSNDNNINLIADNLTQIFSYINNTSSTDNYACQILHQDIGFNIDENENFCRCQPSGGRDRPQPLRLVHRASGARGVRGHL